MTLKLLPTLGFFTILAISNVAQPKGIKMRYDKYKVYEITVENRSQFNQISEKEAEYQLSPWHEIRKFDENYDVMVPPSRQNDFEQFLKNIKAHFNIKIQNVQSLLDAQKSRRLSFGLEWTQYHKLHEINAWIDQIASLYPNIVTPFTIGKSYEGREIKGIKISFKPGNKAVFIESNIHGREWITSATITYIIDQFLVSRDRGVQDIAENIDWYIIPVLNVDGFVYSHTTNRLWRKSRIRSDRHGRCIGTDLNRNFGYKWKTVGASSDPCSSKYAGPYAESEPEIKQMIQFINNSIPEDTIKIYISLHSYGQYVLLPWGYTKVRPPRYTEMMAVAKGFVDALKKRYNTKYKYGSSSRMLYKLSGCSRDWAHAVKKIPLTYTIELRDKGRFGFVLPPEQIIPVAEETLDGFIGMIAAARKIKIL